MAERFHFRFWIGGAGAILWQLMLQVECLQCMWYVAVIAQNFRAYFPTIRFTISLFRHNYCNEVPFGNQ